MVSVDNKGWERSDFPIICETCLGDNPYVRMTKAQYDKECKICCRPFTVFRWRPGTNARYKKTEVCQTCSKMKNVCQVCLLDLEFGLPVQVRDTALTKAGLKVDEMPKSDVNREWFADEVERKVKGNDLPYHRMETTAVVSRLARTAPYYKRNRAHICSFWVKGECTRGDECPYRHEEPDSGELSHQNMKDRYYGVNDPVAKKLLTSVRQKGSLEPPADKEVKTLYVGGLDPASTETEVRDLFYAHGEISSIKVLPKHQCAFVTYADRESAERAAERTYGFASLRGKPLVIHWGRRLEPVQPDEIPTAPPPPPGAAPPMPPPPPGQSIPTVGVQPAATAVSYPSQRAYYPSMDPLSQGSLGPHK